MNNVVNVKKAALLCCISLLLHFQLTAKETHTIHSYSPSTNGYMLEWLKFEVDLGLDKVAQMYVGTITLKSYIVAGYKFNGKIFSVSELKKIQGVYDNPGANLVLGDIDRMAGSLFIKFSLTSGESGTTGIMVQGTSGGTGNVHSDNTVRHNNPNYQPDVLQINVDETPAPNSYLIEQMLKDMGYGMNGEGDVSNAKENSNLANSSTSGLSSQGTFNPDKGLLLPPTVNSFIADLAALTDNKEIQKLSDDLNKISQTFDDIYEFDAMWGKTDANDLEAYNQVESVAQAIAIGAFIYNLFKKDDLAYTPEQEAAQEALRNMIRNTRMLYDEVKFVPHFYKYDESTLRRIEEKEMRLKQYELSTSAERAVYFKYLFSNPAWTIDQLQKEYSILKKLTAGELIEIVAHYQAKSTNIEDYSHMANNEFAFIGTMNKLLVAKAKCFKELGRMDEAEQIMKQFNYNVEVNQALTGFKEAMLLNNYFAATEFYEKIKTHIDNSSIGLRYVEIDQLNAEDKRGMRVENLSYVQSLGVIAYLQSNQISQAKAELDHLHAFNQQLYNMWRENLEKKPKNKQYDDLDLENAYTDALMFELMAKAYYLAELGEMEKALIELEKAMEMERKTTTTSKVLGNSRIELMYLKFKMLANSNHYDKAIEASRDLKNELRFSQLMPERYTIFVEDNFRFELVTMNFKREQFKQALTGLELLIQKKGKRAKYLMLKSDILLALGRVEEAKQARIEYQYLMK